MRIRSFRVTNQGHNKPLGQSRCDDLGIGLTQFIESPFWKFKTYRRVVNQVRNYYKYVGLICGSAVNPFDKVEARVFWQIAKERDDATYY